MFPFVFIIDTKLETTFGHINAKACKFHLLCFECKYYMIHDSNMYKMKNRMDYKLGIQGYLNVWKIWLEI